MSHKGCVAAPVAYLKYQPSIYSKELSKNMDPFGGAGVVTTQDPTCVPLKCKSATPQICATFLCMWMYVHAGNHTNMYSSHRGS